MQELDLGLNKQPAEAQGNWDNLENMGNQLVIEIVLETDVHTHITNQMKPPEEEEMKREEERQESSPGKGKNNGESREGQQGDKMRKRDAKYEEKHSQE